MIYPIYIKKAPGHRVGVVYSTYHRLLRDLRRLGPPSLLVVIILARWGGTISLERSLVILSVGFSLALQLCFLMKNSHKNIKNSYLGQKRSQRANFFWVLFLRQSYTSGMQFASSQAHTNFAISCRFKNNSHNYIYPVGTILFLQHGYNVLSTVQRCFNLTTTLIFLSNIENC